MPAGGRIGMLEGARSTIRAFINRLQLRTLAERIALLRVVAYRRLGKWLVGDLVANLPLRFLDSMLGTEASYHHVDAHRVATSDILPASVETYPLDEGAPPRFHRSKAFDALQIHLLRDVVVSPDSGLMWLPEGLAVGESVGSLHRMAGWNNVTDELLRPVRSLPYDGPVVSAISRNFAHWLFESLPNVGRALEHDSSTVVLLPDDSRRYPPFVEECLQVLLGDEGMRSQIVRSRGPVRVPQALLVQMPVDPYFVRRETLLWIRRTFGVDDQPPWSGETSGRRLYVSRARASKRRLSNEHEVHQLVETLGFQVLFAEDLSVAEKCDLFSTASVVVGPHGAGLASAVWCPSRSTLIELLPSEWYNDYYCRLAAALGQRYGFVQCKRDEPGSNRVDLDMVEVAIKRAIGRGS